MSKIKKLIGWQAATPETMIPTGCVVWDGNTISLSNFDPANIFKSQEELICKVAKSLSRINRYYGQTNKPYSVAQHCWYIAHNFLLRGEIDNALAGLCHDIPETIAFGDIKSPAKRIIPGAREYEDIISEIIFKFLDLGFPYSGDVDVLDKNIAQWEMTVMIKFPGYFDDYWTPEQAERNYIDMYYTLIQMKNYEKHDTK